MSAPLYSIPGAPQAAAPAPADIPPAAAARTQCRIMPWMRRPAGW